MPTWKELRPWIRETMEALDCHASGVARMAGIEPSTILRGLNDLSNTGSPNDRTLAALAGISPIPLPPIIGRAWVPHPHPKVGHATQTKIVDLADDRLVIEIRIERRKKGHSEMERERDS